MTYEYFANAPRAEQTALTWGGGGLLFVSSSPSFFSFPLLLSCLHQPFAKYLPSPVAVTALLSPLSPFISSLSPLCSSPLSFYLSRIPLFPSSSLPLLGSSASCASLQVSAQQPRRAKPPVHATCLSPSAIRHTSCSPSLRRRRPVSCPPASDFPSRDVTSGPGVASPCGRPSKEALRGVLGWAKGPGGGGGKERAQRNPAQPSPAQASPGQPGQASPAQPRPAQPSQPSPGQPRPAQASPAQASPGQPRPASPASPDQEHAKITKSQIVPDLQ